MQGLGGAATCIGLYTRFGAEGVPGECWELTIFCMCWELTTFYMYTQLYMVLLVSEHLLLLKRQPCSEQPTEKILSIDFKDTWIGWNAVRIIEPFTLEKSYNSIESNY